VLKLVPLIARKELHCISVLDRDIKFVCRCYLTVEVTCTLTWEMDKGTLLYIILQRMVT
jgi:hypothetical protein